MKQGKKAVLIALGAVILALLIVLGCIGIRTVASIRYALRISRLLQPILDAENRAMHIAVSADIGGSPLSLETDVYLVTEDGLAYTALEQNGGSIYLQGNALFLENGKAFKIGEPVSKPSVSFSDVLPHLSVLYESLNITVEEASAETAYRITVTGEQVRTLLGALSLGDSFPAEAIARLEVCLTEQNGQLDQIILSGRANAGSTPVTLHVSLSDLRILTAGEYPIPETVKQSAATVDRDTLFSLTEDLYRLAVALAPFTDPSALTGTLELSADCGPLQVDTEFVLSELPGTSDALLDTQALQALPEVLGFLCIEGDIRCSQSETVWVYTLSLDREDMQTLSGMLLPALVQYWGSLTEGSATVTVEGGAVTSMEVSIEGGINALITRIPVSVSARFLFSHSVKSA